MNSLVNYAFLKEQLKRFWPISVITILAYILFIVMPIYSAYDNYALSDNIIFLLSMKHPILIISFMIVPFACALSSFSYLYQTKSTTAIHALPINKKQLMITNIISSFILMIVPLIVLCLAVTKPIAFPIIEEIAENGSRIYYSHSLIPIEIFPNAMSPGDTINSLPVLGSFFLQGVIIFVFYYAVFLIAAQIAGSSITYVLLSGAFLLLPTGLLFLIESAKTFYVFGYTIEMMTEMFHKIFVVTNPAFIFSLFYYYDVTEGISAYTSNVTGYLTITLIIAIILIILSYLCYHLRKEERAGESVVFNRVKSVLIFVLSIFGMVFLGTLFMALFMSVTALYIGFIIGFIIAYLISQMIAEKSFFIKGKIKAILKYGGVALVLLLVVIVVTSFDITGYSRFIPNNEDVIGVSLNNPSYEYNMIKDQKDISDKFFITDRNIIDKTIDVHKEILNKENYLKNVFYYSISNRWSHDKYGELRDQYIYYRLKDNSVIARHYVLPTDIMNENGFSDLLMEDDVVLSSFYLFKVPEIINEVIIDQWPGYSSEKSNIVIKNKEDIVNVLEEIKKDIVISTNNDLQFMKDNSDKYDEELSKKRAENSVSGYLNINRKIPSNSFYMIYNENTMTWLRNNGYIKEIE